MAKHTPEAWEIVWERDTDHEGPKRAISIGPIAPVHDHWSGWTIADEMEEWLESEACDGFNVMFPYLPDGLDDFVDKVIPELQRRELFRTEYEGKTLRENLGLPRPENQFFPRPA